MPAHPATQLRDITSEYTARFPESHRDATRGRMKFANGSAQGARNFDPFAPVIQGARGTTLMTVDGIRLSDFWLGHFAMLRGHSPADQIAVARAALDNGGWFQTGQVGHLEGELAQALCDATDSDGVVFTTTGAQATAAACMMARAATSRAHVVKAQGGWHGVQPWSTTGVVDHGIQECLGMPASSESETIAVPYNDTQALEDLMRDRGKQVAGIILEPVLGNAGMVLASREYLQSARRLAHRYGSCLILDEIVTGFRVSPGPMCRFYEVDPDLIILGKSISGGMPFAAVCGGRRWFEATSKAHGHRVLADLGTFTAHPGTMACVLQELRQLRAIPPETYLGLTRRMDGLRTSIEDILNRNGVPSAATGRSYETGIPSFPIGTIRFGLSTPGTPRLGADPGIHWDRSILDTRCRMTTSKILLLLEGIYAWQGLGALSLCHTDSDIAAFVKAYETVGGRLAAMRSTDG